MQGFKLEVASCNSSWLFHRTFNDLIHSKYSTSVVLKCDESCYVFVHSNKEGIPVYQKIMLITPSIYRERYKFSACDRFHQIIAVTERLESIRTLFNQASKSRGTNRCSSICRVHFLKRKVWERSPPLSFPLLSSSPPFPSPSPTLPSPPLPSPPLPSPPLPSPPLPSPPSPPLPSPSPSPSPPLPSPPLPSPPLPSPPLP